MFQILTILLSFRLYFVSCNDGLYSKQQDYKIEFTRLELVKYDKDVFEKFEVVTFKYNRSLAVANMTFQVKPQVDSSKLSVIVQAYKFLSNEYRIFPARFQLNLCQSINHNIAGSFDIIKRCGNLARCYVKKGVVYLVCNIYPDQSKFPPFIPTGEYKVELTVVYGNLTISTLNGYGKAVQCKRITSGPNKETLVLLFGLTYRYSKLSKHVYNSKTLVELIWNDPTVIIIMCSNNGYTDQEGIY